MAKKNTTTVGAANVDAKAHVPLAAEQPVEVTPKVNANMEPIRIKLGQAFCPTLGCDGDITYHRSFLNKDKTVKWRHGFCVKCGRRVFTGERIEQPVVLGA